MHRTWLRAVSRLAVSAVLAVCSQAEGAETENAATRPTFTSAQHAFFETEVQPILAARCLKCHGGEAKVASDFYVTSRAAVLRGGDLGPAVDLAKPAASPLLEAVRYEALEMPPSGKLPQAEIDILTRWVNEGLPWPTHLEKEPPPRIVHQAGASDEDRAYWAYRPIGRPPVPTVANAAWIRTPIDAFILAKLEEHRLAPSAEAEPRELIRRAAYDLTGLPPTPEEVEAFAAAVNANDAYVALIDRLLASPHYGEKWGRHWLDLVRYAESHGYERDSAKPAAWRYRDYVVQSFNEDKPYDVFLREQLAGDELPNPTAEQLAATGYYRLGVWDDEPADRELARYDELDGIVATTGSVVLGMSVGCARCHDHKRDPIPQRDYYRLLAFFHDVVPMNRENLRRVTTDAELAEHARRIEEKRNREAAWYSEIYSIEQRFLAAAPSRGIDLGGVRGSDLADLRYRLYRDTWSELPDFDSLKAESTGDVASRRISLEPATRAQAIGLVFEGKLLVPAAGEYSFQATAREGVRLLVDGRRVIDRPQRGVHDKVVGTLQLAAGEVPLRLEYFNAAATPKLSLAWSGPGFDDRPLSDDGTPAVKRDEAKTPATLAEFIRRHGSEVLGPTDAARYLKLLDDLTASRAEKIAEPGIDVMCVRESGRRPTHILLRGLPQVKGDEVSAGVPEVLTPVSFALPEPTPVGESSGKRTALAAWLTDEQNPLTARVLANRLWQYHFGRGLVATSNDFGKLGELPTHPELLDWLAAELIRGEWRLKQMHRTIMLSSAYRQARAERGTRNAELQTASGSSALRAPSSALDVDPDNRLLWRFPPRRLTAEEVRDSMLAASGRLDLRVGGASVYPPIPREVLAGQSRPGDGWPTTQGPEANRRSLYVHVKRSLQLPIMATHDQADTDGSCAVRYVTTVPTQALGLMNGEFSREQAAALAQRIAREVGDDAAARVRRAIALTTQRPPTDDEVRRDTEFVTALERDEKLSPTDAWNLYCLMCLNANEFFYLD